MKFILLIAALLIISMASSEIIEVKKSITRSIGDEDVALELKFQGTCEEFRARVLPTVWISKGQSCLPIQLNVAQNPDENDLNAHFFCTHVEEGRSIVHFVEIFETTDATGYANFVLSLIPSNPFRVLTPKTSLARRPNCHVTHDFCNETNVIVDSCSTNKVRTKERKNKSEYVVSNDRIYITANQQVSSDCKANGNCCAYVAPQSFGGICDHVGSKDVLSFPKHHDDHKNDHKNDHKKGGKKGGKKEATKEEENKPEEQKKEEDNQVDEVKKEEDNQVEQKKKRPGQGRKGKKPPTNRKGKNKPNSPAVRPPNHRNGRPASHRPSSNRAGSKRPPTNKKGRPSSKKPINKKPPQPEEEDEDDEDEDK